MGPNDIKTWKRAEWELERTVRAFKGSHKRRAAVEWSVLVEVMLMCCDPGYCSIGDRIKRGVGAKTLEEVAAECTAAKKRDG